MESLSLTKSWPIPEQDEDACQILVIDFLEGCRKLGRDVRVKDMEPVLERLGIPLHSKEHFLLTMADWEACNECGFHRSEYDLMREYPCWERDIRDHMHVLEVISRYVILKNGHGQPHSRRVGKRWF